MAEVHFPGEFHAAHTHLGEYSVGVYYAQVTQPLKAFPSQSGFNGDNNFNSSSFIRSSHFRRARFRMFRYHWSDCLRSNTF